MDDVLGTTEERIAFCYTRGQTLAELAEHFHCSASRIRRILRDLNVPLRGRGRPAQVDATSPDLGAVCDAYEGGASIAALAREADIPRSTLRQALKRAGRYAPRYAATRINITNREKVT
jgi:AraC-like DNA-binding protein